MDQNFIDLELHQFFNNKGQGVKVKREDVVRYAQRFTTESVDNKVSNFLKTYTAAGKLKWLGDGYYCLA